MTYYEFKNRQQPKEEIVYVEKNGRVEKMSKKWYLESEQEITSSGWKLIKQINK